MSEQTMLRAWDFPHKTFEERVAEYGGEITVCDFDWGEAQGKMERLKGPCLSYNPVIE